MSKKSLVAAAVAALATIASLQAATLIHAGRVIDGVADAPLTERTVVVDGGRITAIEAGYRKPAAGDMVIDLRKSTLMPGLMDMHVHLTSEYNRNSEVNGFKQDGPDVVLDGVADFLGGANVGPIDGVINGPDQAAQAVRQRYKEGSDLIKITATGGVLSVAKRGLHPPFTEEEVRAVVPTARDYGFKVAAHAHGAEGMKRAVRAGVDSIEHGTFMDDETIALMKEKGTFYVPTITAGRWVFDRSKEDGFFPTLVRPKAAAIGPQIQKLNGGRSVDL